MKDSFKNKNLLVIIFELLVIILGIIGITFATQKIVNDRTATLITTGKYGVDYIGDKEITIGSLEPIDDNLINIDTHENVIRTEFSVRGVSSNKNEKLIYDVMLDKMNIDCTLLNKYTKWNLYKNGKLISTGSFDPSFDGNVLTDSMHITDIQQNLPKYNQDYDKYVFIVWISEACDNLETCELVDQSNIVNSNMNMNVFIALYSGSKKKYVRVPNLDSSCANKPVLLDNMVATSYKNGEWIVADKNNSDKHNVWYDYANGKWANAMVVSDSKYNNAKVGTVILKEDILAQYVWIPRYRYKLWNVLDSVSDSYNAYDNGIDIIFENGLGSINEGINNDKYLTHPAFGDNFKGFWISKYEMSKENDKYKFVSGVESYRNDTLENYQSIINNLVTNYNLGNNAESHIVNNLEWGATLYLSHSKYGVCSGDGCSTINLNDSYVAGREKYDSTTRNVYGVYDMAGAASEYVIGNDKIGSATNEVTLPDNNIWYRNLGLFTDNNYYIRGGRNRGMFYFGEFGMSDTDTSSRSVIVNK